MQRSSLGLKLPDGMRDMLPEELAWLEEMEAKAIKICRSWAYQKIATPGLEYRACLEPDAYKDDDLYKFFDQNGRILALRAEFTTPIARMVVNRLKSPVLPLRFCYSGDVYRNKAVRYREFRQVGVELVGSGSDLADAEVIALAVEIMKALNIPDFQLNLGHNGIFSGLAAELNIKGDLRQDLEDGISRKDMVRLEAIVAQSTLPSRVKELLLAMPHLTGGEEVLTELKKWSDFQAILKAAESLQNIFKYLEEFEVKEYVALDLGILRGFSYYTGAIFEGYLPGVGIPVVEGGRYDGLYADFGVNYPATGFAMNMGAIMERQTEFRVENPEVLVYGDSQREVIKYCQKIRREGKTVEMVLEPLTDQQAQDLALRKAIGQVIKV